MTDPEVGAIEGAWVIRLACRGGSNFCQYLQILQDNLGGEKQKMRDKDLHSQLHLGGGEGSAECDGLVTTARTMARTVLMKFYQGLD